MFGRSNSLSAWEPAESTTEGRFRGMFSRRELGALQAQHCRRAGLPADGLLCRRKLFGVVGGSQMSDIKREWSEMKYRIRSIVRGVIDGRAMMILRPIRRARELEDCEISQDDLSS